MDCVHHSVLKSKNTILWEEEWPPHKRDLANKIVGGGGGKLTMGTSNFILRKSQI
jgi:hypothetical protein